MRRKINLVGQNTLTVSLPSKWVEKNNIKKGDEVELIEESNRLILGGSNSLPSKNLDFKINKKDELLNRVIFGPYMRGFSSLTYRFDDPSIASKLMASVKKMIGFEIVEQKEKMIRLEQVSSGMDQNFIKLVYRLFFILKANNESVKTFLKTPTTDFSAISELEFECDKISLYCRRLINMNSLNKGVADNTMFYNIICLAEMSGDELEDIVDYFEDKVFSKYKYDMKIDALFDMVTKSFDAVFSKINILLEAKINSSNELDITLANLRRDFKKKYFNLKTDNQNLTIAHHLFSIINHIKHMSQELY